MVVVADGVGWSLDLDTSVDRLPVELRIRKFTPTRRGHDAVENGGNRKQLFLQKRRKSKVV